MEILFIMDDAADTALHGDVGLEVVELLQADGDFLVVIFLLLPLGLLQ